MTEIERKALALLNEVRAEYPLVSSEVASNLALCRAIEQHEAFKQEVSRMVEYLQALYPTMPTSYERFIIPKPVDPLVEAFDAVWPGIDKAMVEALRAAIEKRGGKIVWGEG